MVLKLEYLEDVLSERKTKGTVSCQTVCQLQKPSLQKLGFQMICLSKKNSLPQLNANHSVLVLAHLSLLLSLTNSQSAQEQIINYCEMCNAIMPLVDSQTVSNYYLFVYFSFGLQGKLMIWSVHHSMPVKDHRNNIT